MMNTGKFLSYLSAFLKNPDAGTKNARGVIR